MFKVGDVVHLSPKGVKTYSVNNWAGYEVPLAVYIKGGKIIKVDNEGLDRGLQIYVEPIGGGGIVWFEEDDLILLNTLEETPAEESEDDFSSSHYDNYYTLTENDIKQGKIKVDAYWVAKQWKTGSRDDSGALWHSLKTIARFGDKNSKEREIKALYSQAKALGRIYGVDLE